MLENTDEKLAQLIEKLQDTGFANAPEFIEGVVRAEYYDGLVQVIGAGSFGLLFIFGLVGFGFALVKEWEGAAMASFFATLLGFLLALVLSTAGNPWLKLLDPEAAVYQWLMRGLVN